MLVPLSSLTNLPFFSSIDDSLPDRAAATSEMEAFSSVDAELED